MAGQVNGGDGSASDPGRSLALSRRTTVQNWLCDACQDLDLSVDTFIIGNGSDTSSKFGTERRHRWPAIPPAPSQASLTPSFSLRSGQQNVCLGTRKEIYDRSSNCRFCSLVTNSFEDLTRSTEHDADEDAAAEFSDAKCHVRWEIDGRDEGNSRATNRTRRIRLCWTHRDRELKNYESYLVFVAQKRAGRPNSDAHTSSRKDAHFLGRSIDPAKGKQALIKSWWDLCREHHDRHCREILSAEGYFRDVLRQSYFGVVDVINLQLVSLPHRPIGEGVSYEPYAALSYVWGHANNQPYRTSRRNIMLHMSHGGLENGLDKLPQAVRDSIDLVRRLGIRYIWIDSLCIVQDSHRSWSLNARVMHLIYGHATLTICAADGEDSSTGLLAMDPARRVHQVEKECAPGLHLMMTRPPEIGIRASRWNQRAWTFQERLLSRCCLVFAEGRVYFQCRSTSMSEDIFADGRGTSWSLDSVNAPLQELRELRCRAFRLYTQCVSLYTVRGLTQPGDILAAFSGVCSLLQSRLRAPFIFGLPSSHLDLALLWLPKTAPKRRMLPYEEKDKNKFPSWSWCGWMAVEMEYSSDLLDGCLTNVREWITKHTWICWHIRDGHGNLRPLWSMSKAEEDRSSEEQWRGYRGRQKLREPQYITHYERVNSGVNQEGKYTRPEISIIGDESIASDDVKMIVEVDKEERYERRPHTPNNHPQPPSPPHHHRRRSPPHHHRHPSPPHHHRHPFPPSPSPPHHHRHPSPPPHPLPPQHRRPSFSPRRHRTSPLQLGMADTTTTFSDYPIIRLKSDSRSTSHARADENDKAFMGHNENVPFDNTEEYDLFGRSLSVLGPYTHKKRSDSFRLTLPENPFRVLMAEGGYCAEPSKEFPDLPVLQFWTWQTALHLIRRSEPDEGQNTVDIGEGLVRCDLADRAGDWCGSVIIASSWLSDFESRERLGRGGCPGALVDVIALSEAKAFTQEECPEWTYYVPRARHESQWDLFFIMLVEYREVMGCWQRAGGGGGVGKCFQGAFRVGEREEEWQEIILG